MSHSYRSLSLLFCGIALACLLSAGCGNKKEAASADAKKTFVGAQSPNEVPEQYRKMEKR